MSLPVRIFVSAALLCGAAWVAKTALIAANGGTQTDGGLIGILWAAGMLGLVTAAAAGAVAVLRGRPAWLRAVAGVVAVPLSFVALNLVDGVVKAVYPGSGWFSDEIALVLVGVVLAVCGVVVAARTSPRAPARADAHAWNV
jgi:hypothetical protein